jgi:Ca2+/H+ antiporter
VTPPPARSGLAAIVAAGFCYFAIVFALAFAMGVARALLIAPALGETLAIFLEIPVLLAVSWFVARHLLRGRRFKVGQLVAVGAIAFALTMISEAALADAIRGQSLAQWAAGLVTPLGLVGLAGQLGFALMPALSGRSRFWGHAARAGPA